MRLTFDRGTILIFDAPPAVDLSDLPGVLWDPRVQALRAPAFRHAELSSALARRGVRFADEAAACVRQADKEPAAVRCSDAASIGNEAADTPAPSARPSAGWSAVPLRPYQAAALDAWELAGRRGVVVLPTGSGKTRLALAAMARAGATVLCLVPTRVLMDQWIREIHAFYRQDVGQLGDGVRTLAPVTVATFESAYRHMDRIGGRFELLVVDEAHHFGVGIRDEALEMSVAPARLGLTATPPADPAAATHLAILVGPTVYQLAIGDLAGSFLASFESITLHLELTASERAEHEALMAAFRDVHDQFRRLVPDGTWQDFARAAARTAEGRRALAAWRHVRKLLSLTAAKRAALASLLARHRDARTLVFTADNQAAYEIACGHLLMPLTCDIGRAEREDALARFRRGELRALVSARVLNEGIDVPDADVAIVVGAALGEREHVQRVGRLLRPSPGKRAIVYELVSRGTAEVAQARRRRRGLAPRVAA